MFNTLQECLDITGIWYHLNIDWNGDEDNNRPSMKWRNLADAQAYYNKLINLSNPPRMVTIDVIDHNGGPWSNIVFFKNPTYKWEYSNSSKPEELHENDYDRQFDEETAYEFDT